MLQMLRLGWTLRVDWMERVITPVGSWWRMVFLDILSTKLSAFRLAIDAALKVLKVDQTIMSGKGWWKVNKPLLSRIND